MSVRTGVKKERNCQFAFDRVFDPYSQQYEVFQHTTKRLIPEVLKGYNCTCFAYGATGSGKTHTMVGTEENPGVMVLTLKELYETMSFQQDIDFDVRISYLEIYNEQIKDLLVSNSGHLMLNDDEQGNPVVSDLSSHQPKTADEVLKLLQEGNTRRTQAPTNSNAQSSRSHAILQITVIQREKTMSTDTIKKRAKLSLIDLAGSERASRTLNRGQLLFEGANINKSLLALGNCINALGEGYKEGKFVPYRGSKLTRLLKDSLGGNCKTVMISNISPSEYGYEDTYNTLIYANRAKNIKTKTRPNEINIKANIHEYQSLIQQLKRENNMLKDKVRKMEIQVSNEDISSIEKNWIHKMDKDIDHGNNLKMGLLKEFDSLCVVDSVLEREMMELYQRYIKLICHRKSGKNSKHSTDTFRREGTIEDDFKTLKVGLSPLKPIPSDMESEVAMLRASLWKDADYLSTSKEVLQLASELSNKKIQNRTHMRMIMNKIQILSRELKDTMEKEIPSIENETIRYKLESKIWKHQMDLESTWKQMNSTYEKTKRQNMRVIIESTHEMIQQNEKESLSSLYQFYGSLMGMEIEEEVETEQEHERYEPRWNENELTQWYQENKRSGDNEFVETYLSPKKKKKVSFKDENATMVEINTFSPPSSLSKEGSNTHVPSPNRIPNSILKKTGKKVLSSQASVGNKKNSWKNTKKRTISSHPERSSPRNDGCGKPLGKGIPSFMKPTWTSMQCKKV